METFGGTAIFFQFLQPVVQGHSMVTRKLHEGFERGLTKFGSPPHRDLVFAEEFQRDQLGSFLGNIPVIEFCH